MAFCRFYFFVLAVIREKAKIAVNSSPSRSRGLTLFSFNKLDPRMEKLEMTPELKIEDLMNRYALSVLNR